jgi:hypothetical protein
MQENPDFEDLERCVFRISDFHHFEFVSDCPMSRMRLASLGFGFRNSDFPSMSGLTRSVFSTARARRHFAISA